MEEGSSTEIIYETRHHASRPYSYFPPLQHQQFFSNEGVKGSYLSLLSTRGVSQLKEKWSEYRWHPQKLKKWTSMFVSPRGERVAIAAGNQIIIFQKDDDYQEPCGLFTGSHLATFVCGFWSEGHDILGVTDDTDTLYFIRASGEEITRIAKRHLKGSLPIISVVTQDDTEMKKSCLCTFSILTSDGSLHDIEISRNPFSSISTMHCLNNESMLKKQFPEDVFCLDYYPEDLLFAVVSGASSILSTTVTGFYTLSFWKRIMELGLKPLISTQFEGLYSKPKGYVGNLTSPKVSISPQSKFVATLDLRGCLFTFKLGEEQSSVSLILSEGKQKSEGGNMSSKGRQLLSNIVDFTWWSDHILTIANRSGSISMLDVVSGVKLLENDPIYSIPILERVQHFPGHIFLLESLSSEESAKSSNILLMESVTLEKYKQLESAKLRWTLISLLERSVADMYNVLIGNQKYQAALDFADLHGLDRNEVLKAQWLHSRQGLSEINKLLPTIKDEAFVLSECVNRVAPTEEAVRSLLAYGLRLTNHYIFSESEDDECRQNWDFRLARLKLLQFKDRLETFLGINMGRFSVEDYRIFRTSPINEAAVALAESGKIGALNLLFKRHPYSLAPFMLDVLAAIPETVPVQTYGQLLPGISPLPSNALREEDWVECEKTVNFITRLPDNYESNVQINTEPMVKRLSGLIWPSINDLSGWYKSRARDIDELSGQLDNCLCLVDFACRKGITELQQFHEDICYLEQLIYYVGNDDEMNFTMSLAAWEQLSNYEKFKMMLRGVNEENVIKKLCEKAIPFMRKRSDMGGEPMDDNINSDKTDGTFLVRWLKEVAKENKLDICLIVIEEGCKEFGGLGPFRNEIEAVDCAIQLIYLCSSTDRWSTMASILSKLPPLQDPEVEGTRKRLKFAEGHIEAGRLLAFYQVPKPISFFLEAHSDGKGVKQILRLILSKFVRRQPGRTDNDWANMWRDLQYLQEKAFPFVDLEYMLMEFCRGLLKAGKFSLARNYLKGSGSVALATDKAESLVVQAAREYFFSASSLSCSEIWKAKECLNIFPSSRNVRVEADIIDALTNKLPMLGVNLLPMQFKQIKDPMEIVKLAITSQGGAYLNVDELIEVSKLLGLSSQDDISAVQEAIAREAAVAGDLQLAFDLCLGLAKRGHGSIWELCAALARGPALDNMDISSRKQLLGFALSHCDEESISELLNAWKDLDMQGQCERLAILTGKEPPNFSAHDTSISYALNNSHDTIDLKNWSGQVDGMASGDQEMHLSTIKNTLTGVAKSLSAENNTDWEFLLRENVKVLSFAALRLPWLLELIHEAESGKKLVSDSVSGKLYASVRSQAVVTILSWLARNGFAPRDNLIASLAKSIIEPPVTEEEDILGCSLLLNLVDAFHGVEVVEEQVKTRINYNEVSSIMNVGVVYSLLHNCGAECEHPAQRRQLLLRKFFEKQTLVNSDERDKIDKAQSSFWREWKLKLEEQKRVADHSRVIEQILPGVETERFLSGDISYMESVVFSLVDSVKMEKKKILKDLLQLANTYGLDTTKVLLKFLGSVLISEVWTVDDIKSELSESKSKILDCAGEVINTISLYVYPATDGHNKLRLAYIYGLLSECYAKVEETKDSLSMIGFDPAYGSTHGLANFCKIVEQECSNVSFIADLNFKNIAGLQGLNIECFSSEVYAHVNDKTVEALAEMVKTLVGLCRDTAEGLVPWQRVYKQHVTTLLTTLETRVKTENLCQNPKTLLCFINEIVQTYDKSIKYIRIVAYSGVLDIMKRFVTVILPLSNSFNGLSSDLTWKDSLVVLLNFWLRLTEDMDEFVSYEGSGEKFCPSCLTNCCRVFIRSIMEGKVSPSEGWATVFSYISNGLIGSVPVELFNFCRSLVFSGCRFGAISDIFSEVISHFPPGSTSNSNSLSQLDEIMDLPHLYVAMLETILLDSTTGLLKHNKLHVLLSSLSKSEGDLEELKKVRYAVWESLAEFSDNLQLPSHVRVYTLELMQFIAATGRSLSTYSNELENSVLPWEGWEDVGFRNLNSETTANRELSQDTSNRYKNTLVALKSSQLVTVISSSMEIIPEDLFTVGSAVSCFLKISGAAVSNLHVDTLVAILREWEGLFVDEGVRDEANLAEAVDAGDDWGNVDWDEGWESFQDEPTEKETKQLEMPPVHPLHACWIEIFRKLLSLSRFEDMLKLIDQSVANRNGVLVDEDDVHSLSESLVEVDCFVALKIVLLLPYERIQMEYLDVVEGKLKQGGTPDTIGGDHEFLLLILSSGLVSAIINKPSYDAVFSYMCFTVGNLSRQCQEVQLSRLKDGQTDERDVLYLFRSILFPGFVSELVKGDQQVLAGFLVVKFMHTNAAFSLINIAEASLRWYLEKQLQALRVNSSNYEEMSLVNTVIALRSKMENSIQSALLLLSKTDGK